MYARGRFVASVADLPLGSIEDRARVDQWHLRRQAGVPHARQPAQSRRARRTAQSPCAPAGGAALSTLDGGAGNCTRISGHLRLETWVEVEQCRKTAAEQGRANQQCHSNGDLSDHDESKVETRAPPRELSAPSRNDCDSDSLPRLLSGVRPMPTVVSDANRLRRTRRCASPPRAPQNSGAAPD